MTLETERQRIAAAINQMRPDWPIKSLLTLLDGKQLANRPRRDVAVALAWIAADMDTKTPARVLEDGPWWRATTAADDRAWNAHQSTLRPPKRDEACRRHPGEWASACRGCAGDQHAGTETPEQTHSEGRISEAGRRALEQMRHQIAIGKTTPDELIRRVEQTEDVA